MTIVSDKIDRLSIVFYNYSPDHVFWVSPEDGTKSNIKMHFPG